MLDCSLFYCARNLVENILRTVALFSWGCVRKIAR